MITTTDNPEPRRPWIIAVAGLMGAGKTTLATQLARRFGWSYIPKRRVAGEYIRDLFTAPTRWAFEAQLAMFCSKALDITQQLDNRTNLIVDRSLEEDLGVFASYFYKCGHIDERAFLTY
jgi:deoxyadenosine/deoxycytidine kinase